MRKKIKVPFWGGKENDKSITIAHLSDDEEEKVLGSLKENGINWIRVVNGRLECIPYYKPPPSPIEDEEMLPFWRKATENEMKCNYSLFGIDTLDEITCSYVSISMHSICGYNYTPESYKEEVRKLISYGFDCLRSRRGSDGKFWESWYLPSILFAKGELKSHISVVLENKLQLKLALNFLGQKIVFGSLDISVQRMCTYNPE